MKLLIYDMRYQLVKCLFQSMR